MIAVLLIAVISLTGTITLLGFMNIKMFQQLHQKEQEPALSICINSEPEELSNGANSGGLVQIDANQAVAAKNYKYAVTILKTVVKKNPGFVEARWQRKPAG